VGERERDTVRGILGERMRELEVLFAIAKESEKKGKKRVKTVSKKEKESRHGAQESPTLRKGERQRKNYGERESEKI